MRGEAIKVFNDNEQSSATQFRLKDTKNERKKERHAFRDNRNTFEGRKYFEYLFVVLKLTENVR